MWSNALLCWFLPSSYIYLVHAIPDCHLPDRRLGAIPSPHDSVWTQPVMRPSGVKLLRTLHGGSAVPMKIFNRARLVQICLYVSMLWKVALVTAASLCNVVQDCVDKAGCKYLHNSKSFSWKIKKVCSHLISSRSQMFDKNLQTLFMCQNLVRNQIQWG